MVEDIQKTNEQLQQFRERISKARRLAGRQQKELAQALDIDDRVLSRRLHGNSRDHLSYQDIKRLIKTLASWDAILTRTEALELLALVGLDAESYSEDEWNSLPLKRLSTLPPRSHTNEVAVLPSPTTSLVGRECAITMLEDLLRQKNARLITLLGPGGVGKTRLALAVAHALFGVFTDGVYFIPLATLHDASFVPSTIVQALNLTRGAGFSDPSHASSHSDFLKASLREKKMLIVLDNFEHIVEAGVFVAELLEAAPSLKVLVTSRSVLHLYGEHLFSVPPLEVGDLIQGHDLFAIAQFPAVRLFVERARAVNPCFHLTEQNAVTIAQICLRLDGLALAIELAAARCRSFSPQAVLDRLAAQIQGLVFLHQEARNVPSRQQTLLHTLDWSYHLLDEQAQSLFDRLSIFSGNWTVQAAAVVASTESRSAEEMFDRLEYLVDHSLLVQVPPREDEEPRFRFLETVREYAFAHLQTRTDYACIQECHVRYYLALAEQQEPALFTLERPQVIQLLAREQDNLRMALQWSIERGEVELAQRFCGMLSFLWEAYSHFQEAHHWIDATLALHPQPLTVHRARLLLAAARLAGWEMAFEQARQLSAEAFSLYEQIGDQLGRARSLFQLGDGWYMQGELVQARRYFEECLPLQQMVTDWWGYTLTLNRLGGLALLQGQLAVAQAILTEAVTLGRKYWGAWGLTTTLAHLGIVMLLQGKLLESFDALKEGVQLAQEIGHRFNLAMNLIAMGCTLGAAGAAQYTAQLCSAGEALFVRLGTTLPPSYQQLYTTFLSGVKATQVQERWNDWWDQGSKLVEEQAVVLANTGYDQVYPAICHKK